MQRAVRFRPLGLADGPPGRRGAGTSNATLREFKLAAIFIGAKVGW